MAHTYAPTPAWLEGNQAIDRTWLLSNPYPKGTVEALDWLCGVISRFLGTVWYTQKQPFGKGLMIMVNGAHIHDMVVPGMSVEQLTRLENHLLNTLPHLRSSRREIVEIDYAEAERKVAAVSLSERLKSFKDLYGG